jgi:hypothetical protein
MVRRICLTPQKVEGDNGQRHNLFHSTCTIKGKACQLIINGGCCKNVVAGKAVQKLALDTEKRPTPYHLEWLKKENEIIGSKRCLVNFSIGIKYKNKTWCDMVAMDACHLYVILIYITYLGLLPNAWEYASLGAHRTVLSIILDVAVRLVGSSSFIFSCRVHIKFRT